MPQFNQEYMARRIQPAQFDTILPPDARSELQQPRRREDTDRRLPGPPKRPPQVNLERSPRHPTLGWLLALTGVAALCAVIGLSWPSPEKRAAALQASALKSRETEAAAAKALEALRSHTSQAPESVQPTPVPVVQPTPAATPSGAVPIPVPRAQLVRVPRATARVQLVELTPEHIDESHRITMPYGTEVRATLRGFLGSETQLPRTGRIGDMYVVEQTPWIWIQVPGTTAPTWVDP
jgi:hypothetical protein